MKENEKVEVVSEEEITPEMLAEFEGAIGEGE